MLAALAVHACLLALIPRAGGRHMQGDAGHTRHAVVSVGLTVPPAISRQELAPWRDAELRHSPQGRSAIPDAPSANPEPPVAIATPTGPYYFRASELSRRPVLLGDEVSQFVIELPGFPPLPVILRLLIGADGEVDRVLVEDSYLPEAVEKRIVDMFGNVHFLPGKIGDTAVRSQLKIEVRLENLPEDPRDPS